MAIVGQGTAEKERERKKDKHSLISRALFKWPLSLSLSQVVPFCQTNTKTHLCLSISYNFIQTNNNNNVAQQSPPARPCAVHYVEPPLTFLLYKKSFIKAKQNEPKRGVQKLNHKHTIISTQTLTCGASG